MDIVYRKKEEDVVFMKRNGYISWDEFFMGVAMLAAQRSKDPGTQVGEIGRASWRERV